MSYDRRYTISVLSGQHGNKLELDFTGIVNVFDTCITTYKDSKEKILKEEVKKIVCGSIKAGGEIEYRSILVYNIDRSRQNLKDLLSTIKNSLSIYSYIAYTSFDNKSTKPKITLLLFTGQDLIEHEYSLVHNEIANSIFPAKLTKAIAVRAEKYILVPCDTGDNAFQIINNKGKLLDVGLMLNKTQEPFKTAYSRRTPPISSALFYDVNNKMRPLPTYENFKVICQNYNIKIRYDIIRKQEDVLINGREDNSTSGAIGYLQSLHTINNIGINQHVLRNFYYMLARENPYNSFEEIINNTKWDGKSRLNEFYDTLTVNEPPGEEMTAREIEDYKFVIESRNEARNMFLKAFLQQMLYISLNKSDDQEIGKYILVLLGKQSIGKTTWVTNLLPSWMRENYLITGQDLQVKSQNSLRTLVQKLIVELGEVENSLKNISHFKMFFGRNKDSINLNRESKPVYFRRTTSFIGTTNDYYYLKDHTGTSRFLTIHVHEIKNFGRHNIDMLQLFKELLETTDIAEFCTNNDLLLKQEEINAEFTEIDSVEEAVLKHFIIPDTHRNLEERYNIQQIYDIVKGDKINTNMTHIGKILRKNRVHHYQRTGEWALIKRYKIKKRKMKS